MIREYFYYLRWLFRGKPIITHPGAHCGCCGAWMAGEIKTRDYLTEAFGTPWSVCQKCIDEAKP